MFRPSINGPTSRREEREAAAKANATRYIEERKSSFIVSAWPMLQAKDKPFTATSTVRSPTSTQTMCGMPTK